MKIYKTSATQSLRRKCTNNFEFKSSAAFNTETEIKIVHARLISHLAFVFSS